MQVLENRTEDMALNGLTILLGVTLTLTPWYLDLGYETAAARNAFACGGAITFIAVLALGVTYEWEEYLNLALGLWAVLAPWARGFAEVRSAMGVHVIVGLAVAVMAGAELRMLYGPRTRSI